MNTITQEEAAAMFEGKDARETAGSIRGQRGWLTRAANRLTRLYNELAATPTPVVVAKIEEAMREAEKRTIICAAGYQHLSEEEGLAENEVTGFIDSMNLVFAQQEDRQTEKTENLANHQVPAPAPAIAAPPAPWPQDNEDNGQVVGAARPPKPIESMRPKPLTDKFTPAQFRYWADAFRTFYNSSNLQACSIPDQQQYLLGCMDLDFATALTQKIDPESPIFEDEDNDRDSCMELLHDEFMIKHPLVSRRYEFFTTQQKPGQDILQWQSQQKTRATEADLDQMTPEDLMVLAYLINVTDSKLKEKLQEVLDPTLQEFELLIASHARKTALNRLIPSRTKATAKVTTVSPPNKKNNNQQKAPSKPRQGSGKGDPGKCNRCTGDHPWHACPIPYDKVRCSTCGKQGHKTVACLQGKQNASAKKTNAEEEDTQRSGDEETEEQTAVARVTTARANQPTPVLWC